MQLAILHHPRTLVYSSGGIYFLARSVVHRARALVRREPLLGLDDEDVLEVVCADARGPEACYAVFSIKLQ